MGLSSSATPIYYSRFREAVLRGEIPVNREISQEMNRIDALIANPNIYYDDQAVEGFIRYCEGELTLTDGSDLHLLESFKLWAEQIFGWYYFVERSVYVPTKDNHGGHYEKRDNQETPDSKAVSNSCSRSSQVDVRVAHSKLFFECRHDRLHIKLPRRRR